MIKAGTLVIKFQDYFYCLLSHSQQQFYNSSPETNKQTSQPTTQRNWLIANM